MGGRSRTHRGARTSDCPRRSRSPVFSSDAISSTAYATEEILIILVMRRGGVCSTTSLYISLAVVGLLAIVALSYQQTIHAYPSGGGSYIVSSENLGELPGWWPPPRS